MAISSINGQIVVQTPMSGNRSNAPGQVDDPAMQRITSLTDKGVSVASTDNPAAVVTPEGVEKTRDEQNKAQQPDARQVNSAVEKLNEFIKTSSSSNLQFSVDEESGIRVIKVVDPETKEVIRQMPTKEVVEIAKAVGKLQGLLIKQTA